MARRRIDRLGVARGRALSPAVIGAQRCEPPLSTLRGMIRTKPAYQCLRTFDLGLGRRRSRAATHLPGYSRVSLDTPARNDGFWSKLPVRSRPQKMTAYRRFPVVAGCSGGGRFTEPTAAARLGSGNR
jgi:hypothetical protein